MKLKDITAKGWLTIILVIIILWLIIRYFKNKDTITTTTTSTVPTANPNYGQSTVTSSPTKDDSFPLSFGSRGDNVKKWQTYLNSKGSTLKVDGVWGVLTEAASIKQTGYNSITEAYFNSVVK